MLFDEALFTLMERLDHAPFATFRVSVDHGEYQASFATGVTGCNGERLPNLTDALVSLVDALTAGGKS